MYAEVTKMKVFKQQTLYQKKILVLLQNNV